MGTEGSNPSLSANLEVRTNRHPEDKGNLRDHAKESQLVCLTSLENLNARSINDGLEQSEPLRKLNRIAIEQMRMLTTDAGLKRLEAGGS